MSRCRNDVVSHENAGANGRSLESRKGFGLAQAKDLARGRTAEPQTLARSLDEFIRNQGECEIFHRFARRGGKHRWRNTVVLVIHHREDRRPSEIVLFG